MRASSRSAASAAMSWRRSVRVRVRRSATGPVLIADWDRRPGQAGAPSTGPHTSTACRARSRAEVRAAASPTCGARGYRTPTSVGPAGVTRIAAPSPPGRSVERVPVGGTSGGR